MQVRLATEADHGAVKALYRELRPQDPEVDSDASLAHFRVVLQSPQARLVVALCEGEVGATCMLASIPNFANAGMPIGVIEHVSRKTTDLLKEAGGVCADPVLMNIGRGVRDPFAYNGGETNPEWP